MVAVSSLSLSAAAPQSILLFLFRFGTTLMTMLMLFIVLRIPLGSLRVRTSCREPQLRRDKSSARARAGLALLAVCV